MDYIQYKSNFYVTREERRKEYPKEWMAILIDQNHELILKQRKSYLISAPEEGPCSPKAAEEM